MEKQLKHTVETLNNTYEVNNFKRVDGLYNVYITKTSNLTGAYKGESTYCLGIKQPIELTEKDVVELRYEIY